MDADKSNSNNTASIKFYALWAKLIGAKNLFIFELCNFTLKILNSITISANKKILQTHIDMEPILSMKLIEL